MKDVSSQTKILHTPFQKPDVYNSLSIPVYQSVAYEFESAEAMSDAFCGRTADHTYSRITNPTVQYFEDRVKQITDAYSVTAVNSGMAAISNVFFGIAYQGANIVTSPHLFGNTYSFFARTLAGFGVEVRFCDLTDPEVVRSNIDNNTCAVFLEIITNPQMEVADLKQLSTIAKEHEIPLIADTTIIPFSSFRAKDWGINIEIVSSTKYISGGATSLGGLIIDYAQFDWNRSPVLSSIAGNAKQAFTTRLRKEIHRNVGAYMTPQVAYMQSLGLETLTIRYERQSATCLTLAKRLQTVEGILSVNYTGLSDNAYYNLSTTQFGANPGAMLTIDLVDREACFSFLNRLKIIRRATNLFDNKTLAIHPASTIYGTFTEEERRSMDVSQRTIRLSIGLEDIEDIYADIIQAL